MKEIEIKIEPYSSSMAYYCIYYRYKKKFNIFNFWKQLEHVYDGVEISYNPMLFSIFDDAVEYGEKLKKDPSLIKEHYVEQYNIYQEALKRKNEYIKSRNKSTII